MASTKGEQKERHAFQSTAVGPSVEQFQQCDSLTWAAAVTGGTAAGGGSGGSGAIAGLLRLMIVAAEEQQAIPPPDRARSFPQLSYHLINMMLDRPRQTNRLFVVCRCVGSDTSLGRLHLI